MRGGGSWAAAGAGRQNSVRHADATEAGIRIDRGIVAHRLAALWRATERLFSVESIAPRYV
jgi:hypothetical protein